MCIGIIILLYQGGVKMKIDFYRLSVVLVIMFTLITVNGLKLCALSYNEEMIIRGEDEIGPTPSTKK